MEPIEQKSKLYRKIKGLIEGTSEDSSPFPSSFIYCEGRGKPVFTFLVERKQEDHFID